MYRNVYVRRFLITALLFLVCLRLYAPVQAASKLTIGSNAPPLNIEHWIHEGNKTQPVVTKFESKKVYVIEFWATWCGPCIQSMPKLAKLQAKYGKQGVRIIGVSDEDLETVKEFLAKEVSLPDGNVKTFEEVTNDYSVTTDPDGSVKMDYMAAARMSGIPCSFIVGKDGKIEWIGHPSAMEEPLQQVLEDKWDREAFAQEFNDEQAFETLKEGLADRLYMANGKEPSAKNVAQALAAIDQFMAKTKTEKVLRQVRFSQFDLMAQYAPEDPKLLPLCKAVLKDFASSPIELNGLCWGIYELSNGGQIKNKALAQEALKAVNEIASEVPDNMIGTTFDTISHLEHFLGDLPAALKSARKSADAKDATPDMKAFVEQLEKEMKNKK